MATVPETQTYLDEAKNPVIIAPTQVRDGVKAFVGGAAKVRQQAERLRSLLQEAEIVEDNDAVRGHFEVGHQTLGALLREAGNADRALRKVVACLRQLEEWDADLRDAAGDAGYTV